MHASWNDLRLVCSHSHWQWPGYVVWLFYRHSNHEPGERWGSAQPAERVAAWRPGYCSCGCGADLPLNGRQKSTIRPIRPEPLRTRYRECCCRCAEQDARKSAWSFATRIYLGSGPRNVVSVCTYSCGWRDFDSCSTVREASWSSYCCRRIEWSHIYMWTTLLMPYKFSPSLTWF